MMISVEHLTKYYGDVCAVEDLSFEIGEGHVYGFLGPNGAGKSTTMNIMTGCLSATSGTVRIGAYDIFDHPREAKRLIGYLPEQPPLYLRETPVEYLTFVGEAKGLSGAALTDGIEEVIARTGIDEVRSRRIAELSKGYRQRVGIAQALLGDPKVIILDEPTVGLDPIQIIEIRELIRSLGETHTVIFSSHILSEVQAISDEILIISGGHLIAFDRPDNLEKSLLRPNEIYITADAGEVELKGILSSLSAVSVVSIERGPSGYLDAVLTTEESDIYAVARAIWHAFMSRGTALLTLTPKKASLEEVFLELTEAEDPTALSAHLEPEDSANVTAAAPEPADANVTAAAPEPADANVTAAASDPADANVTAAAPAAPVAPDPAGEEDPS